MHLYTVLLPSFYRLTTHSVEYISFSYILLVGTLKLDHYFESVSKYLTILMRIQNSARDRIVNINPFSESSDDEGGEPPVLTPKATGAAGSLTVSPALQDFSGKNVAHEPPSPLQRINRLTVDHVKSKVFWIRINFNADPDDD